MRPILLTCVITCLWACGGSDATLTGRYEVQDVNVLADDIERGESVRVEVFFETKTELDGTPDGTELVVRVPPELAYVPGTSEIYDGSTEENDGRSPDEVLTCPDGSHFIVYQFSDADLADRNIGANSEFGLRFSVVGRTPTAATYIRAAAGESVAYSCLSPFSFEEEEAVRVL